MFHELQCNENAKLKELNAFFVHGWLMIINLNTEILFCKESYGSLAI